MSTLLTSLINPMATIVTLDTSKLERATGKDGKLVRKYRASMMQALAKSIDNIRVKAVANIIPSALTRDDDWSPAKAARKQPSSPTKVTERTGLLIKMLKHKAKPQGGNWSLSLAAKTSGKTSKLTTNALKGMIKVKEGFRTTHESFIGTLRVHIGAGSSILNDRMARRWVGWTKGLKNTGEGDNLRQERYRSSSRARKQLAMRFKHETGIRGVRRPFIEPAAKKEIFLTTQIFRQKMAELGGTI